MINHGSLRVLLVDDHVQVKGNLETAFHRIGIAAEVDLRVPLDAERRFGCELPEGEELEQYDCALVDLELFKYDTPLGYSPQDFRGGTEVLPYLRYEAPWLPVIALSSYLAAEIPDAIVTAGSFGFDGLLPKSLLGNPRDDKVRSMSGTMWETLLNECRELRRVAAIGEGLYERRRLVGIEVAPSVRQRLDEELVGWEILLGSMFFYADRVALEVVEGGYSGARTFRVFVQLGHEDSNQESELLLKLGRSAYKLHKEARAHLRMTRNCFLYLGSVPLLWRDVLVEKEISAIAYQFARNTVDGLQFLKVVGLPELISRSAAVLSEYLTVQGRERGVPRNLLAVWCQRSVLPDLEGMNSSQALALGAFCRDEELKSLDDTVMYHRAVLHGDLHLGNLLFGERDVLIDFARSQSGPISVDLGRFAADILLRVPEVREGVFPSWRSKSLLNEALAEMVNGFPLESGDIELYDIFLAYYLLRACRYADVDEETKAWIRRVLSEGSAEATI